MTSKVHLLGKVINWVHHKNDYPHLAISFVYDGTFAKTWECLCFVFPHLKPIIELPNIHNLAEVLDKLTIKGLVTADVCSTIDLYRRIYSSNVFFH